MPEHDWESQAYGWTEYFADHPVRLNPKDQKVIQHIEDTLREVGSVSMIEAVEPPLVVEPPIPTPTARKGSTRPNIRHLNRNGWRL